MIDAVTGKGGAGRGIDQLAVRRLNASTDRVCTWET
jgi:hypothetical protein